MNTALLPSLQHLTCCRLVSSLFNHLEVQTKFRKKDFETINNQVKETIKSLIPCARLHEKLDRVIDPLIREIEGWLNTFEHCWYGYDSVFCAVLESVPDCWLSDGTIDRKKSVARLVKNEDLRPINRFVFACTYCFFDDVLSLWDALFKIEKAYLRHKSTTIVKFWVEWLESDGLAKDYESFLDWALGNSLWHSNVFIMRHALQRLSPPERSQHLLTAVNEKEVGPDVVRFCLALTTRDEQQQILTKSIVKVFKCMITWPLRTIFLEALDDLWPYVTGQSFCVVLKAILLQIERQERDYMDLLIIFKDLWAQSPRSLQAIAKESNGLSKPLQFVLDFDLSKVFPKREFSDSFYTTLPIALNQLPRPQAMARRRRGRNVRRRYRTAL